ncbi:MAG: hypothetical protein H6717_39320 [Polyangiaceae bacterium]|nr:hypothetical protein [Polyangiaceae bacterium]
MNSRMPRWSTALAAVVFCSAQLVACGSDDSNGGGGSGGSGATGGFGGVGGTGGFGGGTGATGGSGGTGATGGSGGTGATGGTGGVAGSGGVAGAAGSGGAAGAAGSGGAAGAAGAAGSTGASPSVYFQGDFATNGTYNVGAVSYPGGAQTLTLAGMGGDGIDGLAVSADGSKIAVAGTDTATDPAKLIIYDASGNNGVTVATAPAVGRVISNPVFSKDGNWVGFTGSLETADGGQNLYVVPVTGTSTPKLLSPASTAAAQGVSHLAWAADNKTIAYTGDLVTDNVFGLWTVDSSATTPAPVEIVTQAELGANGDVGSTLAFDSADKLYFTSNFGGLYRLYSVNKDGSSRAQVGGTNLTNGGGEAAIGVFAMSPSGTKIAFSADAPTANLGEVYVLSLTGAATAQLVSAMQSGAPSGTNGPNIFETSPLVWSPDESMLATVADWIVNSGDGDNDYSVFVLPTSGTAGGVRIFDSPGNNQDANDVQFSSDSKRLFVRGDLAVNNDTELYSTTDLTTADQTASSLVDQGVVSGGDIFNIVAVP